MWVLYTPVKHVPLDSGRLFYIKPDGNAFYQLVPEVPKFQPGGFGSFSPLKVSRPTSNVAIYFFVITPTQTGVIGKIPKKSFPVSEKKYFLGISKYF